MAVGMPAAATSDGDNVLVDEDTQAAKWFCNHDFPWENCQRHLPSEHAAMRNFLNELDHINMPQPGSFTGKGIVMSGGEGHVLQALANLEVIRRLHGSELPVEFWHAFELSDAHCEALAQRGAACRELVVPGVYPKWQTTLPAIMSSSFRDVLWIDTDITPLFPPDLLFDTEAYLREGALFWPDLWGMGCMSWGQTAWPHHVAWHLLKLTHNSSDYHCYQEHEAGHLLVNKERHWRPLCLANYLGSRDFFQRVFHGYKDVFRFAWLKLNASNWYGSVRPGIVGGWLPNGQYMPMGLVHFWPSGDEFGSGPNGRPIPLYVHQKKVPGNLMQEVLIFKAPLGECVPYGLQPINPDMNVVDIWDIPRNDPPLETTLAVVDHIWNLGFDKGYKALASDARISDEQAQRLHKSRAGRPTKEFEQMAQACRCDYANNRWFTVISSMVRGFIVARPAECWDILKSDLVPDACIVGYVALALLCSQTFRVLGDFSNMEISIRLFSRLLPAVATCVPHSFWPMRLEDLEEFAHRSNQDGSETIRLDPPHWYGTQELPLERLKKFPRFIRRCVPLPDISCWGHAVQEEESNASPYAACLHCCDPNLKNSGFREECFDQEYTEERCCNVGEE